MAFRQHVFLVIDRFTPTRGMAPGERVRYRFLVGGALLGLLVSLCSAVVTLVVGPPLALAFVALFIAGLVAILVGGRSGLSLHALNRISLVHLGWFLTASCLAPAEVEWNQMAWLVLLPISSLMLTGAPTAKAVVPRLGPIWGAAIFAAVLGVFVLAAHELGWTAGVVEPPGPRATVARLADFMLFVGSVTGLLWAYHVSVCAAEDELARLRQLLAVCAWCKRIRDEKDGWITMEQHLTRSPQNVLTHGICPACYASTFPGDAQQP